MAQRTGALWAQVRGRLPRERDAAAGGQCGGGARDRPAAAGAGGPGRRGAPLDSPPHTHHQQQPLPHTNARAHTNNNSPCPTQTHAHTPPPPPEQKDEKPRPLLATAPLPVTRLHPHADAVTRLDPNKPPRPGGLRLRLRRRGRAPGAHHLPPFPPPPLPPQPSAPTACCTQSFGRWRLLPVSVHILRPARSASSGAGGGRGGEA